MRNGFGIEHDVISKGLPSILKPKATTIGGKKVLLYPRTKEGSYSSNLKMANVVGRSDYRKTNAELKRTLLPRKKRDLRRDLERDKRIGRSFKEEAKAQLASKPRKWLP